MARLTIKAASGSVEDFRVDAQPEWTIRELKNYLYRHYSSHPPITSQKLIHRGRLLLDHETVREIVPPSVDGPVVVHLVAYERSASAPAIATPRHLQNDGNRQPAQDQAGSRQPPLEASPRPATSPPQPQPQPAHASQGSAQVPPWLRYRGPPLVQGYQQQIPVQNLPMGVPGMAAYQFYMSPYGAAYATQMAQWYSNYYARQAVPAGGPVGVDSAPEDIGDRQNVVDRERNEQEVEDDVPMNAGGLGMMDAGGLHRHRDLVDYLYMFMMAGFLALVAYLTGSMGRLLIFAAGVIFMLLNQAGWFSLQRRRQVRQVEAPLPPQPVEEQRDEQEARNDDTSDGASDQEVAEQEQVPPPPPAEPPRPGFIATVFVFVTAFFTSLIPQQRQELQMN